MFVFRSLLLHTPWSRLFIEWPLVMQLAKTVPVFCGTQRFIFMFTAPFHLFLSWSNLTQSMPPPLLSPFSLYKVHLMCKSHLCLCLQSGLFPSGFSTKNLHARTHARTSLVAHSCHLPGPFVSDLITPIIFCGKCKLWSYTLCICCMPRYIKL